MHASCLQGTPDNLYCFKKKRQGVGYSTLEITKSYESLSQSRRNVVYHSMMMSSGVKAEAGMLAKVGKLLGGPLWQSSYM